jgi:hypothetical protein
MREHLEARFWKNYVRASSRPYLEFPEQSKTIYDKLQIPVTTIIAYVGTQSNTICYSFSNGIYYTLSDMFRPIYNGHLQASVLRGVVNTIQL